MRISDWSSDVCSSDLTVQRCLAGGDAHAAAEVHKMTFAQKGTFKARTHPLRKERRFGERHRPRQCDGELSTPETGDQRAFAIVAVPHPAEPAPARLQPRNAPIAPMSGVDFTEPAARYQENGKS